MQCTQYSVGNCQSCQWLDKSYSNQLSDKQQHLKQLLRETSVTHWLSPVTSKTRGFRNKAKMVVSGSVERPLLGMLHRDGRAVDLCDCLLYPQNFQLVFDVIKVFIAKAGLVPYNVERKKGELKYILLTESRANGEMMLRFVLRSETKLAQLEKTLSWLQEKLPHVTVISANIQPIHMAILEGEKEIIFTEHKMLKETFNGIPLYIRPRSFFQTNPDIAAELYATAGRWVRELNITSMWDLFCGAGGFGLHCADKQTRLTGIEISAEAIDCAKSSAKSLGMEQVEFQALDSTHFALDKSQIPELVLVNPPRRGIGKVLCEYLSQMAPEFILYSSCNAQTMAKDITLLKQYRIEKVQLFDMFPHTEHYEALALLVRDLN
ncbi:23S rRNA (uracil(747)-C(5))-methyltransferase RlmC [Xenorhabdus szentirmaii]|uniref:23S rRNA (uracil(747)-C(5))-methyltransferase RlmC n=1 Tax=Xenorhabdus szentirmaii TaxID=290112 RepID=UPI0019A3958D|nr:23S rRNA (uracil(747)-C(5))-methyltransferase RlmC [Xenorhabdus sp. 38]MBD2778982.1 23S rRNA (uracil(747)-C(5))-methyltransferase RlmC [Xenorhabdus sp. 38]